MSHIEAERLLLDFKAAVEAVDRGRDQYNAAWLAEAWNRLMKELTSGQPNHD